MGVSKECVTWERGRVLAEWKQRGERIGQRGRLRGADCARWRQLLHRHYPEEKRACFFKFCNGPMEDTL